MTPATRALLQAFADAHRREGAAREAAATATREAQEAADLQVTLLRDLQAAGLTTNVVVRLLMSTLGGVSNRAELARLASRFRKRMQRDRQGATRPAGAPGSSAP